MRSPNRSLLPSTQAAPQQYNDRRAYVYERRPDHQARQQKEKESESQNQHRVYILSCASCDCFISDRGMRAVLLLKPNITLFSTDSTPFNSSPIPSFGPSSLPSATERTCDCLTQSLGCLGCGATIGYHIIEPCGRCTGYVSREKRTTNGHRWVFHSSEVKGRERLYVEGEPGVKQMPSKAAVYIPGPNLGAMERDKKYTLSLDSQLLALDVPTLKTKQGRGRWSISSEDSYQYDSEVRGSVTVASSTHISPSDSSQPSLLNLSINPQLLYATQSLSAPLTVHFSRNSYFLPQLESIRRPHSIEIRSHSSLSSSTQPLKHGDVVFWHHLLQSGKRVIPFDMERRTHPSTRLGR